MCLGEIWAFDESVVTREQKWPLTWMYVPYLVIPVVMVVDMFCRVSKRVESVKQYRTKLL